MSAWHDAPAVDAATTDVLRELWRAKTTFPDFHSAHEGYAVLLEEVEELWREVTKNARVRDRVQMRQEAIQCAAMAMRFILDVCDRQPPADVKVVIP